MRGDPARFQAQTGQDSVVKHAFLGWDQGAGWGSPFGVLFEDLSPVPLIHLGTAARPPGRREAITPLAIARGQGDDYLVALNKAINEWGRLIYVRPMAEMNHPASLYSYERKRDAAHSPEAYKRAFCRIFLILHGGRASAIDGRLRSLGLPPVSMDLPVNRYPNVLRVIWNPLAGLESSTPGPPAQRYYPGDGCTDMIGNDIFASQVGVASWAANERLYDAHPGKPYSFPEWGLEGVDDPGFIRQMCDFVRTHGRVQMLAYFESKAGSTYDLGDKPRSRDAYRRCLTPMGGPPPVS